jgi:hypothetical protein
MTFGAIIKIAPTVNSQARNRDSYHCKLVCVGSQNHVIHILDYTLLTY